MGAVSDSPERNRFELNADGRVAYIEYQKSGNDLTLTITEVPAEMRGRGVGERLTREVLSVARDQGLKIHPHCPHVKQYIRRHPEYLDLVPMDSAERAELT